MESTGFTTPATSLTAPDGRPDRCPTLSPDEVTALLTTFLDATNNRDKATLGAILASDYVHHWPFGHETFGVEAYLDNLQRVAAVFPDLTVAADHTFAGDGFGAMVWTAKGTQSQPFLGFPPSAHPATWTGLFVHRLACGQIAETWTQADHLSRLQQQGALPAPVSTSAS